MVETVLNKNSSRRLYERARNVTPGGVNSPVRAFEPYPFFVSKAKDARIYTVDEAEYVDYCMAYGALILGHANADINDAVAKQVGKGTLYGAPTELEIEFAEQISKLSPCMEMLRLVNSGTEATMHAIRAARGFTGRKKIVKFEGCYHGSHDCVLVKAGSGAATFGNPSSLGVPEEVARNTVVLAYNDVGALEETLQREGGEVAAVIVEPVMGNAGLILPEKDYLSRVRRLTRECGSLLIFDEIITGFRLALGGAQEYFGVEPDMATLGKVVGGGFPIAVFGGRKDIMQQVSPSGKVYQAGTFSGNPVSATAGLAAVRVLRERQQEVYPKLEKNCVELRKALVDFAASYGVEAQVHNIASMFQVFFTSKPVCDYASAKSADAKKFQVYFRELLRQGVFIPPSQFETCFLSTAHAEEELELTINAFDKALRAASVQGRSA